MAYQNVTKQQVFDAFVDQLDSVMGGFPAGTLSQGQAEALQQALAQKGYDEAGEVIDPDKDYPDLRF